MQLICGEASNLSTLGPLIDKSAKLFNAFFFLQVMSVFVSYETESSLTGSLGSSNSHHCE